MREKKRHISPKIRAFSRQGLCYNTHSTNRGGMPLEQVIYGDVLFFINFSMDFLSFFLCAQLRHRRLYVGRTVIACALGAFYAVGSLFLPLNGFLSLVCHVLVSVILCKIAQKSKGATDFFRNILLFYGISVLMGGCMTALYSLCNSYLYVKRVKWGSNYTPLQEELPFGLFSLLAALAAGGVWLFGRLFSRNTVRRMVTVELRVGTRGACVSALCDSGNLLTDPLSALPVILCRAQVAQQLFPDRLARAVVAADPAAFTDSVYAKKIRMIFAHGIGGGTMLCGMIPDSVTVDGVACRACIAFTAQDVHFGGADALLPAALCEAAPQISRRLRKKGIRRI